MGFFAFTDSDAVQLLLQVGMIALIAGTFGAIMRSRQGIISGAMIGGPFSAMVGGNLDLGMVVFFLSLSAFFANQRIAQSSIHRDQADETPSC